MRSASSRDREFGRSGPGLSRQQVVILLSDGLVLETGSASGYPGMGQGQAVKDFEIGPHKMRFGAHSGAGRRDFHRLSADTVIATFAAIVHGEDRFAPDQSTAGALGAETRIDVRATPDGARSPGKVRMDRDTANSMAPRYRTILERSELARMPGSTAASSTRASRSAYNAQAARPFANRASL
jgi:hypothetical protein